MSNKNDILLSIGLIVKNEEEYLACCLDSLKPIMENIPCQLIVTDTGSTDSTMEIAKKYTNEVYEFEWCDDFAAARNFGLEKAKGQWFMFIDADEAMCETSDLISFFKSGECNNYENAAYMVRSYISKNSKEKYNQIAGGRLYKIDEKKKFIGRIHEHIPAVQPIKILDSYAEHFGYAIDNDSTYKKDKHERNLNLLIKEYEKNKDDIRLAYHLAQEYRLGNEIEAFKVLVNEVYDKIEEDWSNEYLPYFLKFKVVFDFNKNPALGIKKIEEFKKHNKENDVWDMELYLVLADYYFKLQKYADAVKCCDKYLKLFKLFHEGKLEKGLTYISTPPELIKEDTKNTIQILKSKCNIKQKDYNEAQKELQLVDVSKLEVATIVDFVKINFLIAAQEQIWDILPKIYAKLVKVADEEAQRSFEETLETCILDNMNALMLIANSFANEKELELFKNDDYVLLQKLRASMGGPEYITQEIVSCFMDNHQDKAIDPIYADFMIFALGSDEYAEKTVANIDVDDIRLYTKKLLTVYGNLADILINLMSRGNVISLRTLAYDYWLLCLMEIVMLSGHTEENELKKLTHLYIDLGYGYMTKVYNNDVLSDGKISILPKSYRFIYWTKKALDFLKMGNKIEYVSLLRKSVTSYPIMINIVQLLLDSIEEEQVQNKLEQISNNIEFEIYAKNVKSKIVEIANNGLHDEALKLLEAYRNINSQDKEGIAELERMLQIDN